MKAEGTKTAQSVRAIEISAPADFVHRPMGCFQGRHAVAHVALDVFQRRRSRRPTTMPTASTRPNRDRLLSDMPKATRIVNVPTRETGKSQ